ncbi:MAG: glutamate dehydrogenase [Gemmatimonadetes bacterium]|nr:glutamate dehydrogenase [Gemmatimonadota bacterium]
MDGEPVILRDHPIGGKTFALVVQTQHGSSIATTAIHRQQFSRRIGGARFVPNGGTDPRDHLAEVGHLASAMTEKCLAASIPADGQKSVIVADKSVIDDEDLKVDILREHIRAVIAVDPGAIFGPDINVPEGVQDRLAAESDLLDHVTGLSTHARGLSIDTNGYTAEGVVRSIRGALGESIAGARVSVQGFGAVGAHSARLLGAAGARLYAASNVSGALVATGGQGIDAALLFALWRSVGDGCLAAYVAVHADAQLFPDPDDLLTIRVDVFLPAARTSVLAMPEELDAIRHAENPHVRDVTGFFRSTRAQIVVEGANHPLSHAAESYLEQHGVRILPDVIVNCGGLIGCWVEWGERRGATPVSSLESLADVALDRVHRTIDTNVRALLASGLPAREALQQILRQNAPIAPAQTS